MIWLLYLISNYSVYEVAPDGASVKPLGETRVRLVSEIVEARILEGWLMKFNARFTLENLTSEKTTLTVGFPFRNKWFDLSSGKPEPAAGKLSYKAYLDGVEIPAVLSQDTGSETVVYISKITMEPGEKKSCLASITSLGSGMSSS
ncbi:MAG: hypothetical protein ACPL68_02905 [Candidatus Hydrothermia bacterium]